MTKHPIPDYIEHHMPDYHLYDEWIESEVTYAENEAKKAGKEFNKAAFMVQFKEYTDYSIGFITRGCFRKCKFCVNQKYDRVFTHSPLSEFYDPSRKKICLLDDNFFGYPQWKTAMEELIATGKPFKFKQGLDERLLTDEKCKMLFNSNYDGDMTFAFDNVSDYDLIHSKLKLIRKYAPSKSIKFYVLVGFESVDAEDIENFFKRIELLMKYKCLPYVMRYQDKNRTPWKESKLKKLYIAMARWGNQPSIFKKMSFRQFCEANQALHKTKGSLCSSMKAMTEFESENPEIAKRYFDLRYSMRLWAGSADSRFARDLAAISDRFKVVPYSEWETVIDSFANGNNSKVDKGIIYHYYCLKKIRPSYDGAGANAVYEIDHIYAQAQFNSVTTIDATLMESLGNKALLPKLENIAKSDKSLAELKPHDWLYSEVKRVTGIKEEDVEKYSNIVNIQDLINERVADYKRVFSADRTTLLNSTNF